MGSRAAEVTVKATDAVKSLETQPPRDPRRMAVERPDSDDGNWGGPLRPGDLRRSRRSDSPMASASRWRAGGASEAAAVPVGPSGQLNRLLRRRASAQRRAVECPRGWPQRALSL